MTSVGFTHQIILRFVFKTTEFGQNKAKITSFFFIFMNHRNLWIVQSWKIVVPRYCRPSRHRIVTQQKRHFNCDKCQLLFFFFFSQSDVHVPVHNISSTPTTTTKNNTVAIYSSRITSTCTNLWKIINIVCFFSQL